jgi:glutamate N-acetyltransferase/amino-acid N-acetyltransferase
MLYLCIMEAEITPVESGGVTSPQGFCAGAVNCDIKRNGSTKLDLGILFSRVPATTAGVFTTNKIKAAPVRLCQERLISRQARGIVVNSGCANACTGDRGTKDAYEMATLAAHRAGTAAENFLVASTGVIGAPMPMEVIRSGMVRIELTREGGHSLARAMMTTDTVPKEAALSVGNEYTLGGVAKGSGMIHPNMATMLCFITTDAHVAPDFLQTALTHAVNRSFNMVTVDGDTSTNDSVIILANGQSDKPPINRGSLRAALFQQALDRLCTHLARAIARDGEGATRLIEVSIKGAATQKEAAVMARTIVNSSLVKTAVYGHDPNWGRVIAAAGRSGAPIEEGKVDLWIGTTQVLQAGRVLPYAVADVIRHLKAPEVRLGLDLHLGRREAVAWGCDMSEKYVLINSDYTT